MQLNPTPRRPLSTPRQLIVLVGSLVLLIVALILIVGAVIFVGTILQPWNEQNRREQLGRLERVAEVKQGLTKVDIEDLELLRMLADDPQCAETVTSVEFGIKLLSDPGYGRLKDLKNVKEISFFQCTDADHIIDIAKDMGCVESLYFNDTHVSPAALQKLGQFPKLKRVYFEKSADDKLIEDLQKRLPNVSVEGPSSSSKESDSR